jgi:predicted molibdopterin-dependent oxidoreductase YjgC
MGENPMMSEPNLNHTRHQMEQLEFVVTQDLFINESGAFADVFLPATSWAEKEGTFTNTDRRVQRVRQAIPPMGQSRPDWQIVCDLAKRIEQRLGRPNSAYWDYDHPRQVMEEMGSLVPEYAGIKYHRIEKVGLQTQYTMMNILVRHSCSAILSRAARVNSTRWNMNPQPKCRTRSIPSSSQPDAFLSTGTAAR